MSTVEQIEAAIRALSARERDRLAKDIPKLFPELDGDAAWDQIMHDARPRAAFSRLLDEAGVALTKNPSQYPATTEEEFERRS